MYLSSSSSAAETVDGTGGADATALVLDAAASPHVAYHLKAGVYYATRAASSLWTKVPVDTKNSPGKNLSMALDSAGKAYIVYTNKATAKEELVLANNFCGSWNTQVVDTATTFDFGTTVAVTKGVVHIAYHDLVGKDLMYASICVTCPTP